MGQLGFGAMIHLIGGGSEHSSDEYIGKTIDDASLDRENNFIRIRFSDGLSIKIFDNAQSCCESRYMTTDDDPKSLVGGIWLGASLKAGPHNENTDEEHEVVFLEIATDKGHITIANHNEHNGYYGGFGITISEQ